jgi:hypothetical protein
MEERREQREKLWLYASNKLSMRAYTTVGLDRKWM